MSNNDSLEFILSKRGDALRGKQSSWTRLYWSRCQRNRKERRLNELLDESRVCTDATEMETLRDLIERARASFDHAAQVADEAERQHTELLSRPEMSFRPDEAEMQQWKDALSDLARMAYVPERHVPSAIVKEGDDGRFHIYFGGGRGTDKPGHGHHVVDVLSKRLFYKRRPHATRGKHNRVNMPLQSLPD